ncbi:IS66 family insertion sequence element accessory protein TnpB [Burkholderia sp. WP9]|uniref:IS66 family insertion sequence element accessory protein TnpB n=1 Tax=Burkholderia sp. WP9 TaxID=1500263 RepID=UPI000A8ADADE|nr:IS66 family insertion sequence element accessory protein TnpB [Burkholderia sp. WP9]
MLTDVFSSGAPTFAHVSKLGVLDHALTVFGAARPHHAYLFANRRATRMKVLVHDGVGIWLAARP